VHVTACHDIDAAAAGPGKVCRHDLGTAPKEGKGRGKHPPHSNRDKRRYPGCILPLDQIDGIRAFRALRMKGEGTAGAGQASCTPLGHPFGSGGARLRKVLDKGERGYRTVGHCDL
jgi:hypothetical protein